MNVTNSLKVITVLTLLVLMPLTACGKGNDKRGGAQGPPPEAIEACEGKSAGDNVSFSGRRGETLNATCEEVEGQLVAVPEGMRQ